jgi:chemotaxis protein methyltransferase CheR
MNQELFDQLWDSLATVFGLNMPAKEKEKKRQALSMAIGELGFEDLNTGIKNILSHPLSKERIAIFSKHLTIGETYFFRFFPLFNMLENKILPTMIKDKQEKKRLSIWCAGCATGEEAYSLAILLFNLIPNIAQWKISIIGTDVNPFFLEKAKLGKYRFWSFRGVPEKIKKTYFFKTSSDTYELVPEIKNMVQFTLLNLLEPFSHTMVWQHHLDFIFCTNVLIYFSQKQIETVIERFYQCLSPNGVLCVSPVEAPFVKHPGLNIIEECGIYGKRER